MGLVTTGLGLKKGEMGKIIDEISINLPIEVTFSGGTNVDIVEIGDTSAYIREVGQDKAEKIEVNTLIEELLCNELNLICYTLRKI